MKHFSQLLALQETIYIVSRAQPGGAKGAEAPFARSKLRKKENNF